MTKRQMKLFQYVKNILPIRVVRESSFPCLAEHADSYASFLTPGYAQQGIAFTEIFFDNEHPVDFCEEITDFDQVCVFL